MIRADEIIIDNFAGGGGASTAIEQALGRSVDIAINHDREALAMHAANHPRTLHLCEDVWKVDILKAVAGRKVGIAWFSPACTHFSKARGNKPRENKSRGLAWVALRWAKLARPRLIFLENVEEFVSWGKVLPDGSLCPRRKGSTFKSWVTQLRNLGYVVEWRELRACDFGAPTIRKRLFVVARCDGQSVAWPEPTHGKGRLPYRTAAECIDWAIPCPSIFLTRKEGRAAGCNRPLADATLRRIAKGVKRYVIDAAQPFIVPIAHYDGTDRANDINKPLATVTATPKGGSMALVTPFLATYYGSNAPGGDRTATLEEPLRTATVENRHALVTAFLSRQFGKSVGSPVDGPAGTTTSGGGGKTALVAAVLLHNTTRNPCSPPEDPLKTVTTGNHHAVIAAHLAQHNTGVIGRATDAPLSTITQTGTQQSIHTISAQGTHFAEVRAFLIKYFHTDGNPRLEDPMHTVTTKDRYGLITVQGQDYQIVDIGMRMLTPRELFAAQGFPRDYVIDRGVRICDDGSTRDLFDVTVPLTKTAQVRMCGNSVSPPPAAALVRAQFPVRQECVA